MVVTYEEFEKDPMKYVQIAETEEVLLEKNGSIYVHLFNPYAERLKAARSFSNILKEGCNEDLPR